ncbi:hypothetical protein [Streptomyces sp. NPDC052114]|uniref:hypothetical protein n=1 Tax=unclassified Streptomyces TaxID=2593676 RepID=UPI00343E7C5D
MKSKHLAALATAAAPAPTVLGAAPAAAGEVLDTAVTTEGAAPAEAEEEAEGEKEIETQEGREATAPGLTLEGVPDALVAGDDWAEFSVVVDSCQGEERDWTLDLALNTDGLLLYGDDLQVQVYVDGGWRDAVVLSPPDLGNVDLCLLETFSMPEGQLTLPVRIRAGADAPLVDFFMGPRLFDEEVQSDPSYWVWSKIIAPEGSGEEPGSGGEPGGENGSGEEPGGGSAGGEPGGGSGETPGTGVVTPTTPPAPAPPAPGSGVVAPAAELPSGGDRADGAGEDSGRADARASPAATGSDAAARWALGTGGVSIVLGTALAVAAGRRRRPYP